MMGFTTAIKNAMLDAGLGASEWVSLHTADPGTDGSNELSGNGYGRVQVELTAAADGERPNTNLETFGPATTAGWTQVTHFAFWSAQTAGTFKGGFALTTPKTVALGESAEFGAGTLVAKITDPA